ncbi:hypothetical protein [Streptomyces vietnamensis]|uniref:hypothetical protein n=1 Tax=Streptomyces vietnamensis TaxID=362257 RepID=UPI00343C7CFE
MDSRHGFLLLGAVQMTLVFTLASLAVPLPLGGDAVSPAVAAVLFTAPATVTSRTR